VRLSERVPESKQRRLCHVTHHTFACKYVFLTLAFLILGLFGTASAAMEASKTATNKAARRARMDWRRLVVAIVVRDCYLET